MRRVSVEQRRHAVVRRHHLRGDARDAEQVTRALIALHATDPATVYLAVLARSARSTIAEVAEQMYERRRLVRWMAMRRTLFLLPRDDVPLVHAAVSLPLASALRRRLLSRLRRQGTEPPIDGDPGAWLTDLAGRVEGALHARGTATGAELGADVPGLRTTLAAGAPSERPQTLTSPLLTVLGTEGRLVRGTPTGPWTSRNHRWEPVERWWPEGLPVLAGEEAERSLAHRWLARFGPATVEDLRWWTGWSASTVRRALTGLPVEEVDLHGEPGIALDALDEDDGDPDTAPAGPPVATLLPALDPTPMGWTRRDWFLGVDRRLLFDRAGNIGPTLWWDGEVVGSWAVTGSGVVRTALVADRGADARAAVEQAAAVLQERLGGAVVTPACRTPLERSLVDEG